MATGENCRSEGADRLDRSGVLKPGDSSSGESSVKSIGGGGTFRCLPPDVLLELDGGVGGGTGGS